MKVKEKSERVGFKLNIQKTKIMASSPITSWQIDGENVEIVADFICWHSKITADNDCRHKIKRCFLLGRKVTTNLDSILKSRDISLATKVRLIKVMVLPVVMYGCESWIIKKAMSEVAQLCPTLCDSMDCCLPGSSGNRPWSFSGNSTGVGYQCRRTDGFELWYWRRLLRVPWTARRSNQSILNHKVLNIHWKD